MAGIQTKTHPDFSDGDGDTRGLPHHKHGGTGRGSIDPRRDVLDAAVLADDLVATCG